MLARDSARHGLVPNAESSYHPFTLRAADQPLVCTSEGQLWTSGKFVQSFMEVENLFTGAQVIFNFAHLIWGSFWMGSL